MKTVWCWDPDFVTAPEPDSSPHPDPIITLNFLVVEKYSKSAE
jgi:hypothetical protein